MLLKFFLWWIFSFWVVKYAVAQNEFFQDANIDYKNLVPTRGSKVYALEDLEYDGDDIVLKGTEGWVQEVDGDGKYFIWDLEIQIILAFGILRNNCGVWSSSGGLPRRN